MWPQLDDCARIRRRLRYLIWRLDRNLLRRCPGDNYYSWPSGHGGVAIFPVFRAVKWMALAPSGRYRGIHPTVEAAASALCALLPED